MSDLVPIEHYSKYNNLLARTKRVFIRLVTLVFLLMVCGLSLFMLSLVFRKQPLGKAVNDHIESIGGWIKSAPNSTDTVYVNETSEVVVGNKLIVPNRPFNVEGLDALYAGLVITAAYESFREKAYKDGQYPSVGFGFNLHPDHRELFKRLLGRSPCPGGDCMKTTVSKDEAVILLRHVFSKDYQHYLSKYSSDERAALAAALRAYNRGPGSHNRHYVGSCCGAKVGCGSKDLKIRTSHMVRRLIETSIITGTSSQIKDIVNGAENKVKNKLGFNLEVFK